MKLWIDDVRPAPKGYIWIKSVHEAKEICQNSYYSHFHLIIDEINLDHDAGDYASEGGDYIKILDWLEEKSYLWGEDWFKTVTFKFHSANPVGVNNMIRICKKNGWIYK